MRAALGSIKVSKKRGTLQKGMNPLLSIIVICHEQREELRRCLDSILAMQMPFEYEIIVSDDRSTDGTRDMLKEYSNERVSELTNGQGKLVVTYCNSDEGNCANNSQRSGYNRCNAYPLAKGKYIAHVDADDYFREGAEVYVKQVKALEKHPECSLAMSTCMIQNGDDFASAILWPFPKKMINGEVIDAEEFFDKGYFRLNQCFMMRRNPDVNPVALYGNRYVDAVITYHHLQYGNVVYVEAWDYMYVKNESSVTTKLMSQSQDYKVVWCVGLFIPLIVPSLKQFCFTGIFYNEIREVIALAQSGYRLDSSNYQSLKEFHAYIYDCFGHKINFIDKYRLWISDVWMRFMKKTHFINFFSIYLLQQLLYGHITSLHNYKEK